MDKEELNKKLKYILETNLEDEMLVKKLTEEIWNEITKLGVQENAQDDL